MRIVCPLLVGKSYLPARCMHPSIPGGQNVSPALQWTDVPTGAKSFAWSVADLDADKGEIELWRVVNIAPETREIAERASGVQYVLPKGSLELRNASGDFGYHGPIVRSVDNPHRIEIRLWALSTLQLKAGPFTSAEDVDAEIRAATLEEAILTVVATRSV